MSDSGKWEYEIQRWQIQNLITARMNLWGDEGWELVACMHHHIEYSSPDMVTLVFKRLKAIEVCE